MVTYHNLASERSRDETRIWTRTYPRSSHFVMYIADTILINYQVILDPKTSRKIFELARDQQDELEMPDDEEVVENDDDERMQNLSRLRNKKEFDEEDEYEGEDLEIEEEFVRIKSFKFRWISYIGTAGDRLRGFGDT